MIDIQAIGLEVLTGMRQLEYNDDGEKYLTEQAPIDAKAFVHLAFGQEEEAMKLIGDDKVFMKAITVANGIYEVLKKGE